MQQHSQIIELKDRLVQALDEHSNVKDINEVKRIISILEQTHVTREDLEKTRLGKYINELRKKTNDKDLAKRAKKLIKTWRDLTVVATPSSGTPNASALTSPFSSNSVISPHSLSNDSLMFGGNSSYAPVLNPITNGHGRVHSNGSHPALARIRSQHTALTSPNEKSKSINNPLSPSLTSSLSPKNGATKLSASFRPHSQTASPHSNELSNGFKSISSANHRLLSPHKRTNNHSNLTSPVNASSIASNGLSPGLRNNFRNIFAKDGLSPNGSRRRTTPPTPNSGNSLKPLTSSIINPDSAPSSRHCSPLAFTSSNDSRDSNSFSNKNSYTVQDDFSTLDTNDEDSNSSVFSSFSTDGVSLSSKTPCDASTGSKKRGRKRKVDSESDSLRENLNSIMNSGGRRLQSTQELVQKFNLKLNPNILSKHNVSHLKSLSALSSPRMLINNDCSDIPFKKSRSNKNEVTSVHYQNGYHLDENSLSDFSSAISQNKSLPTSPALSFRKGSHSVTTSPAVLSRNSYLDDDEDDDGFNEEGVGHRLALSEEHYSEKSSYPKTGHFSESKVRSETKSNINDIDRQIMEIYAKLPAIKPEDITYMEQFKANSDQDIYGNDEADNEIQEEPVSVKSEINDETIAKDLNDEYEMFEYDEEYEEEVDEEFEVTDSDASDEESDSGEKLIARENDKSCVPQNNEALNSSDENETQRTTMGDILKCDTTDTSSMDIDQEQIGKSKSTLIKSEPDDSIETKAQAASTTTNDDQYSSEAISSSTSVCNHQQEADSTTVIDDLSHSSSISDKHSNSLGVNSTLKKEHLDSDNIQSDEEMQSLHSTVDSPKGYALSPGEASASPADQVTTETTEDKVFTVDSNKIEKKKKTKTIVKRVAKKKYRKRLARSNVKKQLVDRVANEQWEFVNGNYDKDGVWRDFGEITSAYVLRGGENADKKDDENVLHILPYVNYTW